MLRENPKYFLAIIDWPRATGARPFFPKRVFKFWTGPQILIFAVFWKITPKRRQLFFTKMFSAFLDPQATVLWNCKFWPGPFFSFGRKSIPPRRGEWDFRKISLPDAPGKRKLFFGYNLLAQGHWGPPVFPKTGFGILDWPPNLEFSPFWKNHPKTTHNIFHKNVQRVFWPPGQRFLNWTILAKAIFQFLLEINSPPGGGMEFPEN